MLIAARPGERHSYYARTLQIRRAHLEGILASMETHGLLLSEDAGRLWPFERGRYA